MDKKSLIEKGVQEAMDSLDGIQRVSPSPFFYTRLVSRLSDHKQSVWEDITTLLSRPVIFVLSILALILLNTLVVIKKETTFHYSAPDQQESVFVDKYKQANSFYDIENAQP